ncbi:MAG TPA: tetraacyldisaccharide 4'-kinase [Salinimicrobium sp.]|nr:tetraacyldisaccharide 4'-kinase [Salinimicrobium sp.]
MGIRKLLFPFSILYGGLMSIRNMLYEKNVLKSAFFDIPLICVGNLSMGGTGKTPMVEFLISLLKENYKIATLSRGYKRSTSGFQLVSGAETAAEVGDEPLQFKTKFPKIIVAVDEKRQNGIKKLLQLPEKPEVILLDDAFQHRKVAAGMNILLTSYDNLYSEDLVLPAGNLREPVSGAKRAQIIVVTKCPIDLEEKEKNKIALKLSLLDRQRLFFSGITYATEIYNFGNSLELQYLKRVKFSLVTGIANPQPLVDFLHGEGFQFEHIFFPDHHNFSDSELQNLKEKEFILTTEKDYMRLKNDIPEEKLFFLPIKTEFIGEGEQAGFEGIIQKYIMKK